MMQYCQLRLELLGFWIFLNLPNSGFGISSFCKMCVDSPLLGAEVGKSCKKEKTLRTLRKTFSVNKISHGKKCSLHTGHSLLIKDGHGTRGS